MEADMKLGASAIRAVVGPLFVGHGTQKLFGWFGGHGVEGTGGFFESLGLKPGKRNAVAAGVAEAGGGGGPAGGGGPPPPGAAPAPAVTNPPPPPGAGKGPRGSRGGRGW